MAFSVSGLTNYVDETQKELLVRSLYTPKTAQVLAAQIIPGIKSAKQLPILESTVYLQADGCGWTASGTTTFSHRDITVGKTTVMEALCPVTLETKFLQMGLSSGHPVDLGEFQTAIGAEKAATIADTIEQKIWSGDKDTAGEWDGFLTIAGDLGVGANKFIEGNPSTGGGWTQITDMTTSNIDEAIEKIYALLPARVLGKEDVALFMGEDYFRLALLNLKAANLYHYTPEAATNMQMVWPGTNLTLIGLPGLNGTEKMMAGRKSNFYIGTDMLNEEESFDIWYSKDNREVRFECNFKYGTQIAFPTEVVYWVTA